MIRIRLKLVKKQYSIYLEPRIIKKSFCCKCGSKLIWKMKRMVYYNSSKVSKNFNYLNICLDTVYFCKKCGYYISRLSQKEIFKNQKLEQKKILANANKLIKNNQLNDNLYENYRKMNKII